MFSSISYMVSGLAFKSLIHLELMFLYDMSGPISFFVCICPVSLAPLTEEIVFTPLYILCHRLTDHVSEISGLSILFH